MRKNQPPLRKFASLENGVGEVKLSIRAEQVADSASLECFIIRDTNHGFARILREADPWKIAFSEPSSQGPQPAPSRPGGLRQFIEIEWVDFREALGGFLSQFSREAYYLDIESEPPCLYLNRGIEGYHSLLNAEDANSGSRTENLFRDLELKRIALGVWLALCFEAASCLIEDDNDEIVPPADWRGEVLKLMLPRIFPGESLESAYRKVVSLRGQSGTSAYLIGRFQIAVNEQISMSTTLKKHLMSLLREGAA